MWLHSQSTHFRGSSTEKTLQCLAFHVSPLARLQDAPCIFPAAAVPAITDGAFGTLGLSPAQPKQLLSWNSRYSALTRTASFALPENGRWQATLATTCRHSARHIGHTLGLTPGTTPGWSVVCSHTQGTQPDRTFGSSSSHDIAFCRYELCSSIRSGFRSRDTSPRHLKISAT